jgi:hypothetical protein
MGVLNASNLNKIPIFINVSKNVIELNSKESTDDTIDVYLYNNNSNQTSTKNDRW